MVCNGVAFLFVLDESVCGRKLKYKEMKSSWFEGLGVWKLLGCCSSPSGLSHRNLCAARAHAVAP